MRDYKQCCIECRFHFFEEDECPACEAYQDMMEYNSEWDRQLRLLERFTFIQNNRDFWMLWKYTWFKSICQQVSPEIYDWYTSIDAEINAPEYYPGEQIELSLSDLPF